MRISFVLPELSLNGGTKVVAIYAKALKKLGHTVNVVSVPSEKQPLRRTLAAVFRGEGISIGRQASHFDDCEIPVRVLPHHRPVTDDDLPDADVVVATWWQTAEWVSALSPSKGAKAYFIQHHEVFHYLPARSRDTYRMPLRKIVIAKWLQDLMLSEYGDADVDLVPNSVDRLQFYSPPRTKNPTPTVGLLYASAAFKGVDASIAALKILKRRIQNLRIVSFGSERRKRSLKLPAGTDFYFGPSQGRIRELYQECDVWLTASRSEGFNLPALEAMACGTPVVSTRAGWPAEGIVDKVNGILTEVDDTNALADGVEWVITRDAKDWEFLSQCAYQTMASPSWDHSAKLFEAALKKAAAQGVAVSDTRRNLALNNLSPSN